MSSYNDEPVLDWLLSPFSRESFFSDYYEKQVCHIKKGDASYFKDLLSLDAIDEHVANQNLTFPDVKMVNAQEDLDPSLYLINDIVNKKDMMKQFLEGGTVIFSGLHKYFYSLGHYTSMLKKEFNHRVQTNIYLTPKSSQGFKTHYDSHDVFVIQIEGRKKWRIYENVPVPLAMKMQQFEPDTYDPGKVTQELIMEPGDVLYIPRGIMHDAETEGELSLHITTGLLGFTWSDFMVEQVIHLSKEHEAFRKFVSMGKEDGKNVKAEFNEVMDLMKKHINLEDGMDRFKHEMNSVQRVNLKRFFHSLDHVSEIDKKTRISFRENLIYDVKEEGDKIFIWAFGHSTSFPNPTKTTLDFVLDIKNSPFTIQDLPDDMDDESKIVLVQRLVKEGVLYLV